MTPKLTPELIAALQNGDRPVAVENPDTHQVAYLISGDLYERLKPLFEEDSFSKQEQKALLRRAGERAGWNDPEMDVYDDYPADTPR